MLIFSVKMLKFREIFIKIGEFWTTIYNNSKNHLRNFENKTVTPKKANMLDEIQLNFWIRSGAFVFVNIVDLAKSFQTSTSI